MAIPFPNLSKNITTFPEFIRKASEISQGEAGFQFAMGWIILAVITITAFIALLRDGQGGARPPEKILPPTMFISFVSATFMAGGLGILPDFAPMLPLIVLAASIAMMFYKEV